MPYEVRQHIPGYIDHDGVHVATNCAIEDIAEIPFVQRWANSSGFRSWDIERYAVRVDRNTGKLTYLALLSANIENKDGKPSSWVVAYVLTTSKEEFDILLEYPFPHRVNTYIDNIVSMGQAPQPSLNQSPKEQWIEGQFPSNPKFTICDAVRSVSDLPTDNNKINDCRQVLANGQWYYWIEY